jgi:hypothetical protein
VVRTQDPLADGQQGGELVADPGRIPRLPGQDGEAVVGGQGAGVLGAVGVTCLHASAISWDRSRAAQVSGALDTALYKWYVMQWARNQPSQEGVVMVPDVEPYLEIKLAGLQRHVTDINALLSHTGRLEFPSDFPLDGIRRAQVDAEILANRLRENPEAVRALLNAFMTGQNADAQRLIRELNLTESDFQEQGGGFFWIVVIAGVLCCASSAY